VRAVVTLIEADGGHLSKPAKRLRKLNRTLSRLRDADAMLETLATLRRKYPQAIDEHSHARVKRRLASHKDAVIRSVLADDTLSAVDRDLAKLRRAAKKWRPAHRRFKAMATGIRATHRRGRKAMARARKRGGPADFHEWRKEIKALWYQLRLLERLAPAIRRDIRDLDRAETHLGGDHNIVVLCDELSKDGTLCDVDRLRRAATRYQHELRRRAIAAAARIYRQSARSYLNRVRAAFRARRRRPDSAQTRQAA
jgi:CHAD domain-containing protein